MEAYASEVKRLGEQAKNAAQLAPLTVSHYMHNKNNTGFINNLIKAYSLFNSSSE